ncbi:MAG: hypothetical protein H0Z37_04925 [Firmicutes bacterium]|nr:hypothetical protein [Bacillota bacterium]
MMANVWGRRVARALWILVAVWNASAFLVSAATLELSPTGQPTKYYLGFEMAEIRGFDGVTFGMNPEEVESLVAELYPDGTHTWVDDPINLTRLLHVAVDTLTPVPGMQGIGPAGITYVFGAESGRLTAINLNWVIGSDRDASAQERQAVLSLGTAYVAELLQYMWPPGMMVQGVVVEPNSVILFAGQDLEGRGVEVTVEGVPLDVIILPDGIEEHRPIDTGPVQLRIAFAERPDDPDVFTLEPGSF